MLIKLNGKTYEASSEILESLTPREEKVIKLIAEKKTLKEIAKHFSVTQMRVRQIEAKATRKLLHESRQYLGIQEII